MIKKPIFAKIQITHYASIGFNCKERTINFYAQPIRTLDDMSKDEIKKLEKQYGCRVKPKKGKRKQHKTKFKFGRMSYAENSHI